MAEGAGGGWPRAYKKRILERVDSTNEEAKRVLFEGERLGALTPEWILAREQSAGHGRRGRAWWSIWGNFSATLLLPLGTEPPLKAGLRSFWMAVSVLEVLDGFLKRQLNPALSCKWPNDIMCQKRKLGGILLEYVTTRTQSVLLIGVGLNLVPFIQPLVLEKTAAAPISFSEINDGVSVCPIDILTELAQKFEKFEKIYATYGFAPARSAWLERAQGLGENIIARLGDGQVLSGKFEGIDADGMLMLATTQGVSLVSAADIFLR